jgi:putative ABC transport system permease protein
VSELRNADPPLWVAWNQACASIRIRLGRHAVTVGGIGLGIAFFCSVETWRLQPQGDPFESQKLQWLAITSLLMCLVGVTNAMLMSVTERYREIGTMKCLGASDGFVVKVFVLESLILGVGGALGGSLLGVGEILPFASATLSSAVSVIALGLSVGVVMTVVAAVPPAVQAARMPAAAALRVDV